MHIRIAIAHVHPCTKFGVPRSKGNRAGGQKAENNKIAPWGHNFDPSGLILSMTHNSGQGASDLKVWAPGHIHETRASAGHFHAAILQRAVHIFATRCQPLRCLEANKRYFQVVSEPAGFELLARRRGRKSDEVATHNFPGTSSGYPTFLKTQNTAP